jgi:TolB-like protein/tetratricopeptide (TPR) repeat protein
MTDLFVSYKREDAARVRKLVAALRDAGLDVWWDEDIPPSAPWEATIERMLAGAKAVIVCWSPDAVASENVRSEARVAREDGRLIQVFMRPCSPPLFFGERQGIDLSGWRGKPEDPRIAKIVECARETAAGETPRAISPVAKRRWLSYRVPAAIAVAVLLVGSLAGWWLLSPARAEGPQTLAVLPFRALNPADANLVDAIWDDTRGEISRNPNLRVLGRQAVESLAEKHLEPADYRRKVGADYLLDGSVQHVGDRVQMKLSLTRTRDGAEVWGDQVGGKLDDVFAFQQQVAREVEGRIRGRVAPGGGATAQNIATSGEVYALYAQAKAEFRKRNPASAKVAIGLLRKAMAQDPNYAPALALYGQIFGMGVSRIPGMTMDQHHAVAIQYLQRALQLAPNLAHAHAALAMVQNLPPELDGELRKAVQLDPNDAEAWGWLANSLQNQNRLKEALQARNRAVEIEPLWYWTASNKIGTLGLLGEWKGIDAEVARVAAIADPVTVAKVQSMAAAMKHRPGDQVRILLELRAGHPEESSWVDNHVADALIQLDFIEEGLSAWGTPLDVARDLRGIAPPKEVFRREFPKPRDLWGGDESIAVYGRTLPKNGRLKEFIGYYDAAFKSPGELVALWDQKPGVFLGTAPTLAADLRAAERGAEADEILNHAEQLLQPNLKNGPPTGADFEVLAYIRGAQGRDGEAVTFLQKAFAAGWLPDRRFEAADIAEEPCFARLVNRSDFQAIRRRVLERIEEERRKVPRTLLAQAFPIRSKMAA